ncbi:hypothetical protein CSC80_11305 [Maribacter sp. 6B07]|uniref:hypothetical protein n=1 Tax=Maribacter sp. 6B07 TaxID=2045442 RepID=UPI000C06E383|nr:hypothetical protein [Maribacter sp. 6B07]PHN93502.1 hypothetical protein CSC80_11305 [Maribacter sp. 6B07]
MVTLKNFQTKQNLHPSGAIPGFFNLHFHSVTNKTETTTSWNETVRTTLELYHSENVGDEKIYNDNPKWYEHPVLGSQVDVVVLDVTSEITHPDFNLVCLI